MSEPSVINAEAPEVILTDYVGREVLVQRCQQLELSALHNAHVTREELEGKRPGGPQNPDTTALGWLSYLCDLHRWHATAMASVVVQDAQATTAKWSASDAQDLRDCLAENPVYVPLSNGTQKGVYPKGDYASGRIAYIDAALAFIVPREEALKEAEPTPESLEALQRAIDARASLEQEFLWIVTHPGSDVPWAEDGQWDHPIPAEFREYGGYDFDLCYGAYLEVNFRRLSVIVERTHAFKQRGGSDESVTKDSFNGVMSGELGVSPHVLVRQWSKGMLYAQAFTKWEAHERAEARAKEAA